MRGKRAKLLRKAARLSTTNHETHRPKFYQQYSRQLVDVPGLFTIPLTFAHPVGTFRNTYQNLKKEQHA